MGREPVTNQHDLMTAIEIARTYLNSDVSRDVGGSGSDLLDGSNGNGKGANGQRGATVPIVFHVPADHAHRKQVTATMGHLGAMAAKSAALAKLDAIADPVKRAAAT